MFTLLHFHPDDDWSIHSEHQQVIFRAQVGNRSTSSFMQKQTEKPLLSSFLSNSHLHVLRSVDTINYIRTFWMKL